MNILDGSFPQHHEYNFKILVAGEGGVGKSTYTRKYITGEYLENLQMTIGVELYVKRFKHENKNINIHIWDFAGERKFRILLPQYSKEVDGVLILYDITCDSSFESIPYWIKYVREIDKTIPIILIGSKLDLSNQRTKFFKNGEDLCKKYGLLKYIEISSKSEENIELPFEILIETFVNNLKERVLKPIYTSILSRGD